MPSITRSYPAQWAQRMAPAVGKKIKHLETHRIVVKLLGLRGKESVDELSPIEQAEILVDFLFWQVTAEYEAEQARESAFRQAMDASISDFSVGE